MRRLMERFRRKGDDRGATAVEYAIVTALVVGSLSLILDGLTQTSTDAVEQRGDRIGNPGTYVDVVDPGGDDGGAVGDDVIPPSDVVVNIHLDDITNRRSTGFDPKWQASVDVQVARNADPQPAPGVQVVGEWRIVTQNGSEKTQSVNCTTDANGLCTVTAGGLQLTGNKDQQAWFTFDNLVVDPDIYSWDTASDTTTYGTPPTVLICDPLSTLVPGATSADDTCV